MFLGEIQEASELYGRAAAAARRTAASRLHGQILVGWVGVLAALGDKRASTRLAQRAQALLERAKDRVYLGKLHMNLGNLAYHEEQYAEALIRYRLSASAFQASRLRDGTSVGLLINQAVACTNLSRIDEARALFLEADARCRELGLDRLRGQALFDLAYLDRTRGDYREALQRLNEAEEIADRLGARELLAGVHRERSETYLELNMPREAVTFAGTAAEVFEAEQLLLDANIARMNEAYGLLALDERAKAAPLIETVLAFFRTKGFVARAIDARVLQARLFFREGSIREAARSVAAARRSFRAPGMERLRARVEGLAAEIQLANGRPAAAERALEHVLGRTTKLRMGDRATILSLAGRAARARGDRRRALGLHARAVRCAEAQRALIPGVEYRAAASAHHAGIVAELVETLVDEPRPSFEKVFAAIERGRARAFSERARAHRVAHEEIRGLRATLGSVTRRLDEAELDPRANEERAPRVAELRREVRGLERELTERLRRSDVDEADAAEAALVSSDEVMAALGPRAALVAYMVLEERVVALVFGRSRRSLHILPLSRALLGSLTGRIRHQLDAMAVSGERPIVDLSFLRRSAEAVLRELYAGLLAPLEEQLAGVERLTIVPHGITHGVPFECFHDGAGYLDARWVVTRAPTAASVVRRLRPRSGRGGALVSGTLRGGPPYVREEVERVAARLCALEPEVLFDAGTAAWLARARRASLVHVTAHGVFRADNPLFSRVNMGDGALFMADVLEARTRADLVVLSACNSGVVFAGRGDDLSGVSHAFLAAGARQLVASQWRVHDEATTQLMCAFYEAHQADGMRDAGGALAAARRRIRSEWDHPFYWGAFAAYGS